MKRKSHLPVFITLALAGLLSSCLPVSRSAENAPEEPSSTEPSTSIISLSGEEAKTHFLEDFSTLVQGGVTLTLDEAFYSVDAKAEGKENRIDFSGASLSFAFDSLSLHDLHLSLDAPLTYNGVSRYLGAYIHDDWLYFRVGFPSSPSDEGFGGPSMKYKVSLASYTGEYDSEVNGDFFYEYGNLSWVYDEIDAILSSGTSSAPSEEQASTEETKIEPETVKESLSGITESSVDGKPYFSWNLRLKEGGDVYPIGLRATADYRFAGLDFPAKTSGQSAYSLTATSRIAVSASVTTAPGTAWETPSDADSYLQLEDSLGLFRRVASLVNDEAFNLAIDLEILHHEDEILGTSTTFGRDEVDEGLRIQGEASVDLDGTSLDAIGMNVSLAYLEGAKDETGVSFAPNGQESQIGFELESAAVDPNRALYVSLNDATKIATNKTVLDALFGKFSAFDDVQIGQGGASEGTSIDNLLSSLDAIARQVDELKNSAFGQGLEEGHYEAILDALVSISAVDDRWTLLLDLEKAGLSGSIEIVLSGIEGERLARITFQEAKFAFFTLTGTLEVLLYDPISLTDKEGFDVLSHLPGITDEIGLFGESRQVELSVSGYILKEGTTMTDTYVDSTYGRTEQGSEFAAQIGIDLGNSLGAGTLSVTNRMETYIERHYVDIDVSGPEIEGSDDLSDHQLYLRYHSEGATNSPMMGRMSIRSLNDLIGVVMNLMGNKDPRFERITSMIGSSSAASVLSKAMNGLFLDAISSDLVRSFDVSPDKTTIVFPDTLLGLPEDLQIDLYFSDRDFHSDASGLFHIPAALTALEIRGKTGSEDALSDLYFRVDIHEWDIDEHKLAETGNDILHRGFGTAPDKSAFVDYSSLSSLVSHLIDTVQLGVTDDNDLTTYHLTGKLGLALVLLGINIPINDVPLDVFIALDGAEVNVYGRICMPKIRVTSLVDVVPRLTRSEFFYHADGKDTEGTLLLRRYQEWKPNIFSSTKRELQTLKVSGPDFMADILDWILFYIMAMGSIVYDNVYPNGEMAETTKAPINGEDALLSYASGGTADAPTWTIGLDIQELTGISVSMNVVPTLGGVRVNSGSRTTTSLRTLGGKMTILGSLLKVTPDLYLANLVENGDGYAYHDAFHEDGHNVATYDLDSGSQPTDTVMAIIERYFYSFSAGDYLDSVKDMPYTVEAPV